MSSGKMSTTERALRIEWLAVRVIVVGGFVVALAAAVYFGVIVPRILEPRELRAKLVTRVETILKAEAQICTMAINSAKNFGIVPQYGQLASAKLALTRVQGRYVCVAATKAAKYFLTVDLICRELKSPRCTSLYNVIQPDGTVLYQRQR